MTATDATAELAFAGVAVQAELVRRGEVSSRELVELALDRIAALDPELGAFVAVYPDQARAEAIEPTLVARVVRKARCSAYRSRSRTSSISKARSRAVEQAPSMHRRPWTPK